MSLLPFRTLNMSVALLSMQGQKALRFHYNYLNLCSEDERMKIKVLWVRNNMRGSNLFIVESTIPLYRDIKKLCTQKVALALYTTVAMNCG